MQEAEVSGLITNLNSSGGFHTTCGTQELGRGWGPSHGGLELRSEAVQSPSEKHPQRTAYRVRQCRGRLLHGPRPTLAPMASHLCPCLMKSS